MGWNRYLQKWLESTRNFEPGPEKNKHPPGTSWNSSYIHGKWCEISMFVFFLNSHHRFGPWQNMSFFHGPARDTILPWPSCDFSTTSTRLVNFILVASTQVATRMTPTEMNECRPWKRDHVNRKVHLPSINFQGIFVSFQGGIIKPRLLANIPCRSLRTAPEKLSFLEGEWSSNHLFSEAILNFRRVRVFRPVWIPNLNNISLAQAIRTYWVFVEDTKVYLTKPFPQQKSHDIGMSRVCNHTVDGKNPAPVEVGSLSHYLQGFYTSQGGCLGFQPSTVCNQWFPDSKKILAPSAELLDWKKSFKQKNTSRGICDTFLGCFFNGISSSPTLFLFKEDFTPRAFSGLKSPRKWECIPLENFWKRVPSMYVFSFRSWFVFPNFVSTPEQTRKKKKPLSSLSIHIISIPVYQPGFLS